VLLPLPLSPVNQTTHPRERCTECSCQRTKVESEEDGGVVTAKFLRRAEKEDEEIGRLFQRPQLFPGRFIELGPSPLDLIGESLFPAVQQLVDGVVRDAVGCDCFEAKFFRLGLLVRRVLPLDDSGYFKDELQSPLAFQFPQSSSRRSLIGERGRVRQVAALWFGRGALARLWFELTSEGNPYQVVLGRISKS